MEDLFLSNTDLKASYEEDYNADLSTEKALEKAKTLDLNVVIPDAHTVTLDIDSAFVPTNWDKLKNILERCYEITESYMTTSKSGNLHVYFRFREALTDIEKIAIQGVFGSDPAREALNLVRVKTGVGIPCLMFEVKGQDKVPF